MSSEICPLCTASSTLFFKDKERDRSYYRCPDCKGIFMDPDDFVDANAEKDRYQTHNNDIQDPGYRKFVSPLVDLVLERHTTDESGLDFGAGTGPVITHMLREKEYQIEPYDPFFANDPGLLQKSYHYILTCEVVEHFHDPAKEFRLFKKLLLPGGSLVIKTDPYTDDTDFADWYYKNDETHVFFYHKDTFMWIKDHFSFSSLQMNDRLILLIN